MNSSRDAIRATLAVPMALSKAAKKRKPAAPAPLEATASEPMSAPEEGGGDSFDDGM